jgi:hypothetical protein
MRSRRGKWCTVHLIHRQDWERHATQTHHPSMADSPLLIHLPDLPMGSGFIRQLTLLCVAICNTLVEACNVCQFPARGTDRPCAPGNMHPLRRLEELLTALQGLWSAQPLSFQGGDQGTAVDSSKSITVRATLNPKHREIILSERGELVLSTCR